MVNAAGASSVNPIDIERLLANYVITFFINGKLTFMNGRRGLLRNLPGCIIWYFCVCD